MQDEGGRKQGRAKREVVASYGFFLLMLLVVYPPRVARDGNGYMDGAVTEKKLSQKKLDVFFPLRSESRMPQNGLQSVMFLQVSRCISHCCRILFSFILALCILRLKLFFICL